MMAAGPRLPLLFELVKRRIFKMIPASCKPGRGDLDLAETPSKAAEQRTSLVWLAALAHQPAMLALAGKQAA
jgi:hypothetical protein